MGNPKGVGRAKRNRIGDTYGNLVVVELVGVDKHHNALWKCKCACGNTVTKSGVALNNGAKQCTRKCKLGVHVKHGGTTHETRSKEYAAWSDMKRRCFNPNSPNYKHYGGRGISVCDEWVNDFKAFLEHIGKAPDGHRMSVDRINNEGNYEVGNVRWATPAQQTKNRRCSR